METLIFDAAAQERFARLSGDRNPLHVDAVAARRLLTGRMVVHGVHTVLQLLERWPALDTAPQPWQLEAEFLNPLSVGDLAEVAFDSEESGAARALATTAGLPCCRVTLRAAAAPDTALVEPTDARTIEIGREPIDRPMAEWVGRRQSIALPHGTFDEAFPIACAAVGERRVAALALLSTYVGMVCPGLHSVFSSLTAQPGNPAEGHVRFHVQRYDARFRLVVVAFDGALRGHLKAFVRAPAQAQPSTADLASKVVAGEFAGTQHWVLGGSRGLGEVVAKLLGAGGGRVCLSYASGAADARRVVDDLRDAGATQPESRQLELMRGDLGDWITQAPWPDVVWYFPTPRIFRKRASIFDAAVLDEFLLFYVQRFEALCERLESVSAGRPVVVFYPSTIFVDERPKGMTEYAMAKAAAEVLIADLARSLRHVRPVMRRLPRLATDQTSGLTATQLPDNAGVLLPLVREVLAARG